MTEEALIDELLQLIREKKRQPKQAKYPNKRTAIEPWKQSLKQGTFSGKAFSHHTVKNYERYVLEMFDKYNEFSYEALEEELNTTPVEMFGRRDKYFKAILCFGKFLAKHNSIDPDFVDKVNKIKPKRHIPAKQNVINEQELHTVIKAAKTKELRLIIIFLATTGLRASEFCSLKFKDLNLEEGYLTVQLGKGGKRRRVGLKPELITMVEDYLKRRKSTHDNDFVWLNKKKEPMTRDGLLNRLRRLGQETGIPLSPHVLRRAFVTINANKGRSLVMLQMACGHADIKTTRSYCKTTEDEVIQAMQKWD